MFTKWMLMQCLIFGTFGLDNFQCTEPGAVCSWNDKTSLQSAIQFVCAHKFELDAKQLLDWEMKLNRQEIDHLQDLLSLSDITFLHQLSHHVTTKLFECLYELREKNQLIEINVDNAFIESSAFPIDSINGIYIDARQEYNTEKIFIRMHSLDDVENANSVRFALFYTSDNTWAIIMMLISLYHMIMHGCELMQTMNGNIGVLLNPNTFIIKDLNLQNICDRMSEFDCHFCLLLVTTFFYNYSCTVLYHGTLLK
eukprot:21334_1